jgi:GntR family transcriptional regulator, vanillate catabolism transcriptional regulator
MFVPRCNRMLGEMIRTCHCVPVSSSHNIVAFEHRDVRRRHDDFHRIYEAIIAGEPWRAELLMREHVSSVKGSLIRALAARNADPTDQPST